MERESLDDVIPATQESSEVIQPINRETVHRICSGQVVLSLAIAVKELVENAIDAGATIIDIRLKEYGSELIEVSDNGKGVVKENFQALTLKHYTSKIKQFDDLQSLSTLGFRGEALSSLCALSDLTILTKHETAQHATKITYDRNGKILEKSICAREVGTTVTLENLFSTLPVRRKEFMKNLKREFNKMCQLLYAYCLVSKGIKFSCTNVTNKGSKNVVVSTEGLNTVKENITNVFGAKQISSLIEVEMVKPEETILAEYGLALAEGEPVLFSFEFFVSSVMHGNGRSTSDRQFFYINSRPCDPTKLIKLVNEVYKQYNHNQYPFIYLNVISKSGLVDVNVTPDKRQVFLEKEKMLLATVKASLVEAFKMFPCTYKMENVELSQTSVLQDFFDVGNNKSRGLKRSITESGGIKKGSITERFKKRSKTENDKDSPKSPLLNFFNKQKSEETDFLNISGDEKLETFVKIASESSPISGESNNEDKNVDIKSKNTIDMVTKNESKIFKDEEMKIECKNISESPEKLIINKTELGVSKDYKHCDTNIKTYEDNDGEKKVEKLCEIHQKKNFNKVDQEDKHAEQCDNPVLDSILENIEQIKENNQDNTVLIIDKTERNLAERKSVTLNVSLDAIKESLKKKNSIKSANDSIKVRFRSEIAPESNKSAEEELQKHISKEDFAKMVIIGQFNLGFIVTKLYNDLFIIDQHATDEKYNFEQLQENTVMESQVLVNPKPLELTAGHECLLIENEEIFKKNGFSFKIDQSAPCTKKVALTSVPLSKNVVFGKDEIDEMLFMLQESNHTMCRPSRIRAVFASRACRKSVMIGKALSRTDMRKLVNHMGEIEQPWNCPHGRPTMRHLINLDLLQNE